MVNVKKSKIYITYLHEWMKMDGMDDLSMGIVF